MSTIKTYLLDMLRWLNTATVSSPIRLHAARLISAITTRLFRNLAVQRAYKKRCEYQCLMMQKSVIEHYFTTDTAVPVEVFTLTNGSQSEWQRMCNMVDSAPDNTYFLLCDKNAELHDKIVQVIIAAAQHTPTADGFYFDNRVKQSKRDNTLQMKPQFDGFLQLQSEYIGSVVCLKKTSIEKLSKAAMPIQRVAEAINYSIETVPAFHLEHIPLCLYTTTDSGITNSAYATASYSAPKLDVVGDDHSCPLVSIIIPTRNQEQLVRNCIASIYKVTKRISFEVLLVDNQSDCESAKALFSTLQDEGKCKLLHYNHAFNYSAINNRAVEVARGKVIIFMNNDIELINKNCLEALVCWAVQDHVGAVGAKLYYPNNTIQHSGVILGLWGCAGHGHKHYPRRSKGYMNRLDYVQQYSAVTGALLAVKKEKFAEVGGFNEKDLSVSFNDVDLCLKLQQKGYKNIWTPHAEAYHHESISRGAEDTPEKKARERKEIQYMQNTWKLDKIVDPAYNPWLTHNKEDFSIRDLRELKSFKWNL